MADFPVAANSPQLLAQVGQVMDEAGVRWCAIGALAVAYHGWVRASMDADALVTMRDSKVNSEQLIALLRSRGWEVEFRDGDMGDPIGFVIRIRDGQRNMVDLIGGIRKLDPAFFERRIDTELDGMKLRFASVEDLVALKIFAGGPKDLEDAAGVLEIRGASINRELLVSLCHRFGHETEKRCKRLLGTKP